MLHLLNTPDAVRTVSWKQLHEWVQQYPYAQHLRLIAARKAKIEGSIDLQVLLELAATYAPSRRFLYEYLSNTSNTPIPKNMYHTYDDEPTLPDAENNNDNVGFENDNAELGNDNVGFGNDNVELGNDNVGFGNDNVELGNDNAGFGNDNAGFGNDNVDTKKEEEKPALPSAETNSFGDWLAMLGGIATLPVTTKKIHVPLPEPEDEHEDLEDLNAENEVRKLAQSSVETNHDIISETLAKLLEIQGKVNKAIEMYIQLSLKHPEKAAAFAEKIAALKAKTV